jgi:xanthine dehydrogenase small subunit
MIEFLLNQTAVQVQECMPSLSVLDWLRTYKGLKGVKEGCASGDCGACTVVIGAWNGKKIEYKSVNACLILMGQLHGQHLLTIESITTKKDLNINNLHPVQRALVECHGSQCGFCTPGFIMSMYALYLNEQSYPGEARIIEALGGNLCRCTGYRPIIAACKKMYDYPREVFALGDSAEEFFQRKLRANPSIGLGDKVLYLPQTLPELLTLKATRPNARLVAGGTDLSLEFSQQLKSVNELISVSQVKELKGYQITEAGIHIGASLPYSDWLTPFSKIYPEALEMLHRLGSEQIRNVGTLGGSIGNASPIGDPAPLLIALDTQVTCVSETESRTIPLVEFFTGYRKTQLLAQEVIASIFIPARSPDLTLACYKVSKRIEDDISAVLMVVAYELDDNKVAKLRTGFGGMAATPASAKLFEEELLGQTFTLENLKAAGRTFSLDFKPMSDVRASDTYRLNVCENLLERLWQEYNFNDTTVRIAHAAL